jgi:hypothetical protein
MSPSAGLGDKIKVHIVSGVLARTVSSKTGTSRNRRRIIVSLLYRRQTSARGVVCQLKVSSRSIQSKTIGMIGASTVRIAILHTFPPPRGNVNSTSTIASLMVLRGASLSLRRTEDNSKTARDFSDGGFQCISSSGMVEGWHWQISHRSDVYSNSSSIAPFVSYRRAVLKILQLSSKSITLFVSWHLSHNPVDTFSS